jgi:hypothetical protein
MKTRSRAGNAWRGGSRWWRPRGGQQAVLTLLLGAGLAAPVHAQTTSPDASAEPGLKITLRVYNYAHIPPALLSRSEEAAAAIFRQAGVEAAWVDCPLSGAELDRFPACQQPLGRADFALRILTAAMTRRAPTRGEALGFALPCPEDLTGCYAEVFYQRVAGWASGAGIARYQLLGHAMAHEIGHLLLGPNSHSGEGIMRPQWNPNDLAVIARVSLRFTPEQAGRLRAACLGRIQEVGIAASANGVPPR